MNVPNQGVSGNYTPYSQANNRSCVLTGHAVSETASPIDDVDSYCTMPRLRGTICTTDGLANNYAEWPDSVTEDYQRIPTSNNPGLELCSKDTEINWLADIGF